MNFLSTFRPLIINSRGRSAVKTFGLKPYIDASCRREPDFESEFPSISAVCHAGKFAPRLNEGDVVVFMTVKNKYPPISFRHWRLVSILRIQKKFKSHEEASIWYSSKNLPLPSNCMVEGNKPFPLEKTAGPMPFEKCKRLGEPIKIVNFWDSFYKKRVEKHSVFLACKAEYLELNNPIVITDDQLLEFFGNIPGTRNPPRISDDQLEKIQEFIRNRKQ